MRDAPDLNTLEIIGTTTVPADLPKRLSPVYRRKGGEGPYYFTVAEDEGSPPLLSPEDPAYFRRMVEAGDAVAFAAPLKAQVGHCLLQVEASAQPEYLPMTEVPVRLRRASREALERAARALAAGHRGEAEELAWYARRAEDDDPLPLLMLIPLLRGLVGHDELRFLEEDLEEYPTSSIEAARRRVQRSVELSAIADLLEEPPASGERPAYLHRYPCRDDFLPWTRRLTAEGRRRRQA